MVEDDIRLCGYAVAVLDAKKYFSKLTISWIPELIKKYPKEVPEEQQQSLKNKYVMQFIEDMHRDFNNNNCDPEEIFKTYPSLLNITVMANIMDLSVPKRMLTCVIAALKANGLF